MHVLYVLRNCLTVGWNGAIHISGRMNLRALDHIVIRRANRRGLIIDRTEERLVKQKSHDLGKCRVSPAFNQIPLVRGGSGSLVIFILHHSIRSPPSAPNHLKPEDCKANREHGLKQNGQGPWPIDSGAGTLAPLPVKWHPLDDRSGPWCQKHQEP